MSCLCEHLWGLWSVCGHCRCGCRDKSAHVSKGGWIWLLEVQISCRGAGNKALYKFGIVGLGGVFMD